MRKVVLTPELLRRVHADARFRAAVEFRPCSSGLDREPAESGWRERGACAQTTDPDVFFPASAEELEPARQVCRSCPVLGACLAEALDRTEIDGVWGATTSAERRTMRAVWRADRGALVGTA